MMKVADPTKTGPLMWGEGGGPPVAPHTQCPKKSKFVDPGGPARLTFGPLDFLGRPTICNFLLFLRSAVQFCFTFKMFPACSLYFRGVLGRSPSFSKCFLQFYFISQMLPLRTVP